MSFSHEFDVQCLICKKLFLLHHTTRADYCPHCETFYAMGKYGIEEPVLTLVTYCIVVDNFRYRIEQHIEENKTVFQKIRHPLFAKSKWKTLLTLNHLKFFSPDEAEYFVKNKLKLYMVFS